MGFFSELDGLLQTLETQLNGICDLLNEPISPKIDLEKVRPYETDNQLDLFRNTKPKTTERPDF